MSTGGGSPAAAISSGVGSNGSISCTTSFVSPRSLWSTRPRTITRLSTRDLRLVGRVGGVEDQHLDLALEVVERREHHRLAGLGADALRLRDQAADRHPRAVGLGRELGQRAVHARAQQVAHVGERMAGEEDAERLLLHRKQLDAVELVRGIGG